MFGVAKLAALINSAKNFLSTVGSASTKLAKGTTNAVSKGVNVAKKHPYMTLGGLGAGYAGYNALSNYAQKVTAEPDNSNTGYVGSNNIGMTGSNATTTTTNNGNTALPPIKENFKHSPLYNLSDWELENYRRTWGETSDYRRAVLEKEANGANPYVHEVDPRLLVQNQQIAPVSTNTNLNTITTNGNLGSLDLNDPEIQKEFKLALISKGLSADVANYALAQAMLETGYGKKLVGNNNFFNITVPNSQRGKGLGNARTVQEYVNGVRTPTSLEFKNYQDLNDLAGGYVDLLQRKYNGAYNAKTIDEFTAGLKGWTPDPYYASKVAQVYNSKFRR